MPRKQPSLRRTGRGLKSDHLSPPKPVELHLVVTRASGDTERYKLGEVPTLHHAIAYRRKLSKVTLPKKVAA